MVQWARAGDGNIAVRDRKPCSVTTLSTACTSGRQHDVFIVRANPQRWERRRRAEA